MTSKQELNAPSREREVEAEVEKHETAASETGSGITLEGGKNPEGETEKNNVDDTAIEAPLPSDASDAVAEPKADIEAPSDNEPQRSKGKITLLMFALGVRSWRLLIPTLPYLT